MALNRPTGMKALLYLLKQCLMKTDFCCCHYNFVVFLRFFSQTVRLLCPSDIIDSFDFMSYPTPINWNPTDYNPTVITILKQSSG